MGTSQSSTIDENQEVVTNIAQSAFGYCNIEASQDIEGNVVTDIGGTGNINLKQQLGFESSQCSMSQILDTNVKNILASIAKQKTTKVGGFPDIDFSTINQDVDIAQHIRNTLTQQMYEQCQMGTNQQIRNNYVFAQDTKGDINLSQTGNVTGASCTMSAAAKATVQNSESAKASQISTMIDIIGLIIIAIIVIVIIGAVGFFLLRRRSSSSSSK